MTVRTIDRVSRRKHAYLPDDERRVAQIVEHFTGADMMSEVVQCIQGVLMAKPLMKFDHQFGLVLLAALDATWCEVNDDSAAIIMLLSLSDEFIAVKDLIDDHVDRMLNDKGVMSR